MTHWRFFVFPVLAVILGVCSLVIPIPKDPPNPLGHGGGPSYDSWRWADAPIPGMAPNVLLISVDCLRADHLGCYGYARPTSPNIDRLAREGALFEWAIAGSSWTLPSHLGLFTSIHWPVRGAETETDWRGLNHPRLPEVLREAGYTTAGVYAGPLVSPAFGFDKGFDHYFDCQTTPWTALSDITGPRIHEALSGWVREEMREPFFLFVHYWDVHGLYIPPAPYDRMFDPEYEGNYVYPATPNDDAAAIAPRDLEHIVALYDGEIRWTDKWIGDLLGLLEAKEILDSTLVILIGDHGEQFGEHGKMGHGHNLHDETIRVPLIVRLPGKVARGNKIEQQVRLVDIYPTVLDLLGLEPHGDIVGRSLAPLLDGRTKRMDLPPAFSSLFEHAFALRTREWKVIHWVGNEKVQFFDLVADPGEQSPLPGDHDERSRRALEELQRFRESLERLRGSLGTRQGKRGRADPDVLARLRALGYLK